MMTAIKRTMLGATLLAVTSGLVLSPGATAPALAQDAAAATTVALPMQRTDGERFVIEASQVRERIEGDTVVQSARQESVVVATVGSVDADGYILDVDTQSFEMSGGEGLPSALADRLTAMQIQMPVKIQMTPEGAVEGLANRPEVVAFAQGAMSEVAQYFDTLEMPDEGRAMIDQMITQLSDPGYLEQSLLQSPRLYFFLSGAELELDATYYLDDAIVFPLFTQPLPSRIYFGIREVDDQARTVTYDWWQEPDQDVFRQQLEEFIRRLAEQAGGRAPGPNEIDFSSFTYSAEASLVYDLDSGLPVSMMFVKAIDIQGRQQVETIEAHTRFE